MVFLLKNTIWPMTLCLNLLKMYGLLVPGTYTDRQKIMWQLYSIFWVTYVNGIFVIAQVGDLFQVWGDLSLMVSTSFLLFTNLALTTKILNVMLRKKAVQDIIDDGEQDLVNEDREEGLKIVQSCNRETSQQLYLFAFFTTVTVLGWAASAEKNCLPLRAWFPYDTSKSPAYEITYMYQVTALCFAAYLNVSMDTLATCLISICRHRLKLLNQSLTTLCCEKGDNNDPHNMDEIALNRLKSCVHRHQAVLKSASEVQRCFSVPILAQFTVSMVIICVTAYQLAVELHSTTKNMVRIGSMVAYLLCMILQVFLYCYQGNQLMDESTEVASAAYSCPWYSRSLRFRRALLIVMVRSKQDTRLTAGGFTTISLDCFTAIVKASYTFFTVLQRVEDRQK